MKVLLTGEVSDELFGYKYTDFAPDADRSISSHGLEARVSFGDTVMAIDPAFKMNTNGVGKSIPGGLINFQWPCEFPYRGFFLLRVSLKKRKS